MSRLSVGLINMHTATSPLLHIFKVVAYWEINFNMLLRVVGGLANSFGDILMGNDMNYDKYLQMWS